MTKFCIKYCIKRTVCYLRHILIFNQLFMIISNHHKELNSKNATNRESCRNIQKTVEPQVRQLRHYKE